MAIFAIADLHLALSNPEKSMEVFGKSWDGYITRLEESFRELVSEGDTVLMPGDISWATYMSKAEEDFKFIDSLPGKKIIGRGNHDYWWTTVKKMEQTLTDMGVTTISLSNHTSFVVEDSIITGTRAWKLPADDSFSDEDRKIYEREKIRIGLCVQALNKEDPEHTKRRILMLHYPPLTSRVPNTELSEIIEGSGIDLCIYGHLHGKAHKKVFEGERNGTLYKCVSADYLGFSPVKL